MGLFDLFSGAGKQRRRSQRDAGMTAQGIVTRYHQRRARGEFRVDDKLYLELTQVLSEAVAQRVDKDFRVRRAHSHPKAEGILLQEIVTALLDLEHFSTTAKLINRPPDPEATSYAGMTLRERAQAKVLEGRPLTDAEEDAMLWG